ncbi:TetR/AcrR family transcriptional regulator [Streptomyces syringium]|uniref:TetR/AcrR family transcriptional regulator n=1 Tax=Streptomyces syringium TaxID=76729 RepID=UPI0033AB2849
MADAPPQATTVRGPRKDQARNRRRLLDAAREAFKDLGPDAGIDGIARRAGVGATTFYRHFPTKDDLVDALLDELSEAARNAAGRAAGSADGWTAFRTVFTRGCVPHEEDLALFDTLCRTGPRAAERGLRATVELIGPVVERARREGLLRADATVEDIAAFMRMADSAASAGQRRRAHDVLLAGLRSRGGADDA